MVKKRYSLSVGLIAIALVLVGCSTLASAGALPTATAQTGAVPAPTVANSTGTVLPTATSANRSAAAADSVNSVVTTLQNTFEQIYNNVTPSIVTIEVMSQVRGSPFGRGSNGVQQGLGSGFVWDKNGNIVTNNHVIDGATQISVVFSDGSTAPGKVVGADPQSDLAVVKVDVPADRLHPVQMGSSADVRVGEFVIAIGNPFGEQNTMTSGIISALGRYLPSDVNASGPTYTIPDVIQTDAAINPGNSGGVLVNMQGQVIGVTSAIESQSGSSAGIGFAIPAQVVAKIVPDLIGSGSHAHSYLGISAADMTAEIATAMKLDPGTRGALVVDVTNGGPAEKAGLKASSSTATISGQDEPIGGDVITAIDGKRVQTFNDLVSYLELSTKPGQTVTLTIVRDGKEQTATVTLGARPANSSPSPASETTPFSNGQDSNGNPNYQPNLI